MNEGVGAYISSNDEAVNNTALDADKKYIAWEKPTLASHNNYDYTQYWLGRAAHQIYLNSIQNKARFILDAEGGSELDEDPSIKIVAGHGNNNLSIETAGQKAIFAINFKKIKFKFGVKDATNPDWSKAATNSFLLLARQGFSYTKDMMIKTYYHFANKRKFEKGLTRILGMIVGTASGVIGGMFAGAALGTAIPIPFVGTLGGAIIGGICGGLALSGVGTYLSIKFRALIKGFKAKTDDRLQLSENDYHYLVVKDNFKLTKKLATDMNLFIVNKLEALQKKYGSKSPEYLQLKALRTAAFKGKDEPARANAFAQINYYLLSEYECLKQNKTTNINAMLVEKNKNFLESIFANNDWKKYNQGLARTLNINPSPIPEIIEPVVQIIEPVIEQVDASVNRRPSVVERLLNNKDRHENAIVTQANLAAAIDAKVNENPNIETDLNLEEKLNLTKPTND